jgi:hypothetical protein
VINKNAMNEKYIFLFKIRIFLNFTVFLTLIIVIFGLESYFWGYHIKRRTVFLVKKSNLEYKNYASAIKLINGEIRNRELI